MEGISPWPTRGFASGAGCAHSLPHLPCTPPPSGANQALWRGCGDEFFARCRRRVCRGRKWQGRLPLVRREGCDERGRPGALVPSRPPPRGAARSAPPCECESHWRAQQLNARKCFPGHIHRQVSQVLFAKRKRSCFPRHIHRQAHKFSRSRGFFWPIFWAQHLRVAAHFYLTMSVVGPLIIDTWPLYLFHYDYDSDD